MALCRARSLLLRKKLLLLQFAILYFTKYKGKNRFTRKRRWWVHKAWQNRKKEGAFETLMKNMRSEDPAMFKKFLRLTPAKYDELLGLVGPKLKKKPHGRQALCPSHRLAITLRFLAAGSSFPCISFLFRVGFSTVKNIIYETCDILWNVLQPLYMPVPTKDIWKAAEKDFAKKWNFPGCIGAVDGKHVVIEAPKNSGSMFYNHKGSFSIVLMAVVDASYRFLVVDIGGYGSHSDGGIFNDSSFGRALDDGTINLPEPLILPGSHIRVPHVFVGDEAFQLRPNFLRPFPGTGLTRERRVMNYRISRSRRCSENAFGIMGARFRVFRRPLNLQPDNTVKIVKACVVLHNYLRSGVFDEVYCPNGFSDYTDSLGNTIDGEWRNEVIEALRPLPSTTARNYSAYAADVRLAYMRHFMKEGQVPWQWTIPGMSPS